MYSFVHVCKVNVNNMQLRTSGKKFWSLCNSASDLHILAQIYSSSPFIRCC